MTSWVERGTSRFTHLPLENLTFLVKVSAYVRNFKTGCIVHYILKVEFIVMGGTFMCLDESYRDFFIRNLHDALSGHTSNNVDEAVK